MVCFSLFSQILFEEVLIFVIFLKRYFLLCMEFQVDRFFFTFNILKRLLLCFLVRNPLSFIFLFLCTECVFLLWMLLVFFVYHWFSVSWLWCALMCFCMFLMLGFVKLLVYDGLYFHQIWKKFCYYFFRYIFCFFLPVYSFWNSHLCALACLLLSCSSLSVHFS